MTDHAPSEHVPPYLVALLEQWRACPSPGVEDGKPLLCRLRAHEFRALLRTADATPSGLPAGVTVLERGTHRVLLQVEGVGVVRVTSAKPASIFEAIAEMCDRIAREHEAGNTPGA